MALIPVSDQPETHTTTGPDPMRLGLLWLPVVLVGAAIDLHQRKYGDDTPAD